MPRFSSNTLVELIDALQFSAHHQIETFVNRFEIPEADNGGTLGPRINGIVTYLNEHPARAGPFGANLVIEIIEYLIETRCDSIHPDNVFPRLVRALKRNGYILQDGRLEAMLPEGMQIASTEDEQTRLLRQFNFSVASGHFDQAMSAFTRGDWAAANAQLRTFIESLFDSIAEKLVSDGVTLPPTSNGRRELLTQMTPPFLLTSLNEWESHGKGFVQGFWRRLNPEGSHPGLSDEEDSTFRLHLVLIVANHYLRRLSTRNISTQ